MLNLRIISTFAHKMAPVWSLRVILLNLGWTYHLLTSVTKIFKDYGCLGGDIEDNIKLGLKCSYTLSWLVQLRVTALGFLWYATIVASHIWPNSIIVAILRVFVWPYWGYFWIKMTEHRQIPSNSNFWCSWSVILMLLHN